MDFAGFAGRGRNLEASLAGSSQEGHTNLKRFRVKGQDLIISL